MLIRALCGPWSERLDRIVPVRRFSYEECLGEEFWREFLEIAAQEARHFLSWANRLEAMGLR